MNVSLSFPQAQAPNDFICLKSSELSCCIACFVNYFRDVLNLLSAVFSQVILGILKRLMQIQSMHLNPSVWCLIYPVLTVVRIIVLILSTSDIWCEIMLCHMCRSFVLSCVLQIKFFTEVNSCHKRWDLGSYPEPSGWITLCPDTLQSLNILEVKRSLSLLHFLRYWGNSWKSSQCFGCLRPHCL